MQLFAVIPCFNEASHVGKVVLAVRPFVEGVIVVNDGSRDASAVEARAAGATVVSHAVNLGLGAALGTGFAAALKLGADAVVTLDADEQHIAEEVAHFREALAQGNDAVIGSRFKGDLSQMPAARRFAQRAGNMLTFLLFGLWTSDSQSGFRAFSRRALEAMRLRTNRMEVSSEIIGEIARLGLPWTEVPITAVYTDYSLSKGQSARVGAKTALRLFLHRLKG
jgi:glycosyltransferase involved in cell wall biosynthesis